VEANSGGLAPHVDLFMLTEFGEITITILTNETTKQVGIIGRRYKKFDEHFQNPQIITAKLTHVKKTIPIETSGTLICYLRQNAAVSAWEKF